jgi:hypothetical protein
MSFRTFVLAAAALAAAALSAVGATTGALTPLAAAVAARRDATGDATRADRVVRHRLDVVAAKIAQPSDSVADDLRIARGVGTALSRWFRGDTEFAPLFDDAIGTLSTAAQDERARLAAWVDAFGGSTRGQILAARLRGVSAEFARADRDAGELARLGHLRGGCARIDKARVDLKIVGDVPSLDAAMPAFAHVDVNPRSPTHGRIVSPRDYLGMTSAWYFGHAT